MAQTISEKRPEKSGKGYRVYGLHIYGNFYNCRNIELMKNPKALEELVEKAAREGNMTILDIKSWKIGEGVSVVAIILESHISIHTWPEYGFSTVDVYSCGQHTDPRKAFEVIREALDPEKVEIGTAERHLE